LRLNNTIFTTQKEEMKGPIRLTLGFERAKSPILVDEEVDENAILIEF
jgi:hypothetical protein